MHTPEEQVEILKRLFSTEEGTRKVYLRLKVLEPETLAGTTLERMRQFNQALLAKQTGQRVPDTLYRGKPD